MDGKGIDGAVMEDHPIPSVLKAAKKTALDKVREMIIREQIKYQGYQAETISDPAIDQSTAAKEVITLAEKIFLQDVCFADLLGAIDDLRGMIGLHRPGGPGEQVAKLIRYIFKVRGTEGGQDNLLQAPGRRHARPRRPESSGTRSSVHNKAAEGKMSLRISLALIGRRGDDRQDAGDA